MSSPEDHEHAEEEEQGAYYNVPDPVLRVARRLYGRLTQSGEVVREEGFVARSSLLKHLNQLGVVCNGGIRWACELSCFI